MNVKKKMTAKAAIIILSAIFVLFGTGILTACGEEETRVSSLIGTFTDSGSVVMTLSSVKPSDENAEWLSATDIYPVSTVNGEIVNYEYDQSLALRRDFTYEYDTEILVRKVAQTGNTDLARMTIETEGTFDYIDNGDMNYTVTLSDPTSGSEKIYAPVIADEGNVYSWDVPSTPSFVLDIAAELADGAEHEFDRYTRGREIRVERDIEHNERNLTDNVVWNDFLEDVAPYSLYAGDVATDEDGGDTEQPTAPQEEEELYADLPFTAISGTDAEFALRIAKTPVILIRTPSSDVTVGGANAEGKSAGDIYMYEYPVSYAALGEPLSVVSGGKTGSADMEAYLRAVAAERSDISDVADASLSASVLYYASAAGADVTVTDDERALVYVNSESKYNGNSWGERDSMTENAFPFAGAGGISWTAGEEISQGRRAPAELVYDGNGAGLSFRFTLPSDQYEHVTAFFVTDGKTTEAYPEKESESNGQTQYVVRTGNISPLDFDKTIYVGVKDGDTYLSSGGEAGGRGYSVMRAAAFYWQFGAEEDKQIADAVYSLGKSATWVAHESDAAYTLVPSNTANGTYRLTIGNYDYADARMQIAPVGEYGNAWGVSLYACGQVIDDDPQSVTEEGFSASRKNGSFTVTLNDGFTGDGISTFDGGSRAAVTVLVGGKATLDEIISSAFSADPIGDATIGVLGDLTIAAAPGAVDPVLTLKGGIFTDGNLTVSGVTVNIPGQTNADGVVCSDLTIEQGAELNIDCAGTGEYNGVNASGNVTIGGALRINGAENGIFLGTEEQTLSAADGSVIEIDVRGKGITGPATTEKNRTLNLAGGNISIRSALNGIEYADVTVGSASLSVETYGAGNAIASADNAPQVTFRTTSGSEDIGKVRLVTTYFDEFDDRYSAIKAQSVILNGGNVYISSMCRGGAVTMPNGGEFTMDNCDVTIESGHDIYKLSAAGASAYGKGIDTSAGGARIVVGNSSKLIVKSCQVLVNGWTSDENVATLVNDGLIIMDGFMCSLEQWELGSWTVKLNVSGNGQVRYFNDIG